VEDEESALLDAARAIGVPVATRADELQPHPDALRIGGPPIGPRGPVPLAIRDGELVVLWAASPTAAEVNAYAATVGLGVSIVLASAEVTAAVVRRAGHSTPRPRSAEAGESGAIIERVLAHAVKVGASDLHLTAGYPPVMRLGGVLSPVDDYPVMSSAETERVGRWIAGSERSSGDCDVAFTYGGHRFRANIYRQRGTTAVACRVLPLDVPELETLGLPDAVRRLVDLRHGLVLLCGPTGSGKSTTLAAIVDAINHTRPVHITTIEDPIEYVHRDDRAVVHQREIGGDAMSFASALRSALRQDPDVILVGEIRDPETVDAALTAAETGHLVLSTLHTGDAESSVSRIINAFPEGRQAEARTRLATVLRSVVCQKLLPRRDRADRCGVVTEILVNTRAIASLIRTNETHQIRSLLETGSRDGMQTFADDLSRAVGDGWLDAGVARAAAHEDRALRVQPV
jgi:twitching motility protein PilT